MTKRLKMQSGESEDELLVRIADVCEQMEKNYEQGFYSKITVKRHWSKHNPTISGEMARPSAYRWYLRRELLKLVLKGADIQVEPSRARGDLNSPSLLEKIDESDLDITRKKLFLFGPERVELSIQRLEKLPQGAQQIEPQIRFSKRRLPLTKSSGTRNKGRTQIFVHHLYHYSLTNRQVENTYLARYPTVRVLLY